MAKPKKYKFTEANCPACRRETHVKNCPKCGRNCMCYWNNADLEKYYAQFKTNPNRK